MNRACWVVLLAALVLTAAAQAATERVTPLVVDPRGSVRGSSYVHVQDGTTVETARGGLPIVEWEGKRAVKLHATHSPEGSFHVGIAMPGWTKFYLFDYGPDGALEFDVTGSMAGKLEIGIVDVDKDRAGPDQAVGAMVDLLRYVTPTAEWQHVAIPLRDFVSAAPDIDLDNMEKVVFNGSAPGGETTLYLANVLFRTTAPERVYRPIKVDQVGYPRDWRKVAKVTAPAVLKGEVPFLVRNVDSGEAAYNSALSLVPVAGPDAPRDQSSGDIVYNADFSDLRTPGTYVVEVIGPGMSVPFRIAEDVYDRLFYDVARFWFFQRCGMELKPEHAGPYAHRACHAANEAIRDKEGRTRDCRGGWHDAGDMNCYTPWTIQPIFMLLSLHRHNATKFTDGQLNLPESGNGVPDLLDEIKYELDWVRKMLIREGPRAGQVYGRVHEGLAQQPEGVDFYDTPHGLSDTSDEAACALVADLAHAYMVYKEVPQERDFAEACLDDALLSWDYLNSASGVDGKHLFTAAVLLFEATGREDAHAVVKRLAPSILDTWMGHINYGVFDGGLATYCLSERPEVDEALQATLRHYYKTYADAVVAVARAKAYNTPMIEGVVFSWGSNGHCIAKSGAHLLMVNRFAPDEAYVETARDTLHWLLGRNAVTQCMVTGYGTPPLGPIYHSMFGPLGPGLAMPPGYLPGGPTHSNCPGISVYPAKAWRADYTSWQLTEPSLTYQGSFTYLVGSLAALGGG